MRTEGGLRSDYYGSVGNREAKGDTKHSGMGLLKLHIWMEWSFTRLNWRRKQHGLPNITRAAFTEQLAWPGLQWIASMTRR